MASLKEHEKYAYNVSRIKRRTKVTGSMSGLYGYAYQLPSPTHVGIKNTAQHSCKEQVPIACERGRHTYVSAIQTLVREGTEILLRRTQANRMRQGVPRALPNERALYIYDFVGCHASIFPRRTLGCYHIDLSFIYWSNDSLRLLRYLPIASMCEALRFSVLFRL